MTGNFENRDPIKLDDRQTDNIQKFLDEIDGPQQGFQAHAINWGKLPQAVLSCSKAGLDILGLAESGGLDVTKLPALTIDGVACYQSLKAMKS